MRRSSVSPTSVGVVTFLVLVVVAIVPPRDFGYLPHQLREIIPARPLSGFRLVLALDY